MRSKHIIAFSLGIFLCLLAPSLSAQPSDADQDKREKALKLFEEAEAYYNVSEFEEALSKYKEAYLLSREPALLFNMAQCYRQLKRYEEAIRTYKNFIKETPDSPLRANVEELIKEVEMQMAQGSTGGDNTSDRVPPGSDPETNPITPPDGGEEPSGDIQPTSIALTPENPEPAQPATPRKRSKAPLFLAAGGGALGALVLIIAIGSSGGPPTDLGTFDPFGD